MMICESSISSISVNCETVAELTSSTAGYEEGEKLVSRWEKEFREWIEKNKGKKKDIVVDKGGVSLKIKDEEGIFELADSYMGAVVEGSVKQYWEKF